MRRILIVIAVLVLGGAAVSADFSYTQTTRVTGGTLLNMTRFMPGAGQIKEPKTHTIAVKGGKMVTYDAAYHESNNYVQGDPKEMAIKEVQARIIADLANPQKCVIAGCSNGELVRQCRRIGIDASDTTSSTIREITFQEVRS